MRSFIAVFECGSFSVAAEELSLTQPAVSQHVRQLEDQLGLALMLRDHGRLKLTPGGAALLPAFRQLLASNKSILDTLSSISQGTEQILRIASPASFAALHITPAYQAIRTNFPNCILDIAEIDDELALQMIRSGDIDFGISSVYVSSPGLKFEVLHQDNACVVMAADNPLANDVAITDEEVLTQPIIRFPIGTTSNDWLSDIAVRVGREPEVVAEVRQLLTGFHMVRQNLGIAIVPVEAARACMLPGLKVVELASKTLLRTLGMISSDNHIPSKFEIAILDHLRSTCKK